MFHQDETTSSILRRYLKNKKENERRFKELIHQSSSNIDDEVEDDEVLDLTLDDIDEENMIMEHHR